MMGLLLSAVALFGVLATIVGQRRAEIGIRRALGAQARQLATMIVRHSLTLAVAGLGVGLLGAPATTRLLRLLLFEVDPSDPLTLAAVAALLVVVALVAAGSPRVVPRASIR